MIPIPISKTTLINPHMVSAIDTRKAKGQEYYVIIVDGKEFDLEVSIDKFLADLKKAGAGHDNHHFAG